MSLFALFNQFNVESKILADGYFTDDGLVGHADDVHVLCIFKCRFHAVGSVAADGVRFDVVVHQVGDFAAGSVGF